MVVAWSVVVVLSVIVPVTVPMTVGMIMRVFGFVPGAAEDRHQPAA